MEIHEWRVCDICVERHVRLGKFISSEKEHGCACSQTLELFYYLDIEVREGAEKTGKFMTTGNDTVAHVVLIFLLTMR